MKKVLIVIDKCWLQGRSKEDVLKLSGNNHLLLIDMLWTAPLELDRIALSN